jgi:hypothetical protein
MQTLAFKYRIKLLGLVITVLVALIFAKSFLDHRREPQFDQLLFITSTDYPTLANGISSFLIASAYNALFDNDFTTTSTHIKIGAMAIYLLAGWLLFTRYDHPHKTPLAVVCLLLLLTTRFPFGWLTTEVIAGGFLILVLWSYTAGLPFIFSAVFLAGFSFAKPDLIFSGIPVGLYMAYLSRDDWRGRFINGGVLAVAFLVLLIPAGLEGGTSSNRSLMSLHQHYAVAVERHQIIADPPDPWAQTEQYLPNTWGDAASLGAAIWDNPRLYYDFLFLSIGNTIYNIFASGVILLVPVWGYCFYKIKDRRARIITLLFLIGIIPITLLSFMHTRYLTRFYPLMVWIIYLYAAEEYDEPLPQKLITTYLVVILILQIVWLNPVLKLALWVQTTRL